MSNSVHMPVWMFMGFFLGAVVLGAWLYRKFWR